MEKNYLEKENAYLKKCIKELELQKDLLNRKIGSLQYKIDILKESAMKKKEEVSKDE